MEVCFIPQPQSVRTARGSLSIPARGTISIGDAGLHAAALAASGVFRGHRVVQRAVGQPDTLAIYRERGLEKEAYRLRVRPTGASIEAASSAGAAHAVRTLQQLVVQSPDGRLPCVTVTDGPDLAVRGVYYDVARGRVPTTQSLVAMVRELAAFKINQLQLYVEHTFRFRGHPAIGRRASPLTAEDILQLDIVCRDEGVELVPSLASFGHMSRILTLPAYRELAEDHGACRYESPEASSLSPGRRRPGWTLSPANPEGYEFLDSLFAEFLPLFSSDKFNVCCDETWDLGYGQSYRLCRQKGRGRVYLNHILRLRDMAARHGKTIQFWGDIIRHYPELLTELPDDVTVLDWGYDHDVPVDGLSLYRNAALPFMACPGTSSWVTLFPRLHESRMNIHRYAAAASELGADGLLNTDWGDGGHYNFMELSWYGYVFGAEQAWRAKSDRKSFTERFARLFLRSRAGHLPAAIDKLGDITHLRLPGFYQSIWAHVFFAVPGDPVFGLVRPQGSVSEAGRISRCIVDWAPALGQQTVEEVESVADTLTEAARERGADPCGILPYWIFATKTIRHAARKLEVFGTGGRATLSARRELRREMHALAGEFEDLWMRSNRRSEIRIALGKYRRATEAL